MLGLSKLTVEGVQRAWPSFSRKQISNPGGPLLIYQGRLFVCLFVLSPSPKPQHLLLHSWYCWMSETTSPLVLLLEIS